VAQDSISYFNTHLSLQIILILNCILKQCPFVCNRTHSSVIIIMSCDQTIHSPQWPFSTLKSSGDILWPEPHKRHGSYDGFWDFTL